MSLGKIIYYILYLPVLIIGLFAYVFIGISFLAKIAWELSQEFHKEIKEF